MPFEMNLSSFLNYLEDMNLSKHTILAYKSDVTLFFRFLQDERLASTLKEVTVEDLFSYIISLQQQDKSSATIARHISSLRGFYEFAIKNDLASENIANKITPPTIKRTPTKSLTLTQMNDVLQVPDTKTFLGMRDKAILELLYGTGIRISELVHVNLSDVYVEMGYVQCGSPKRMVPFGDTVAYCMDRYIKEARPILLKEKESNILFINFLGTPMSRQGCWKMIKEVGNTLHIELSPDLIRDTFIHHMLSEGAPAEALQVILGVKDFSFVHTARPKTSNLKEVLRQNHPRP